MSNSYYIKGSCGDIVYAMAMIKQLGGGLIYNGLPIELHKALKPLVESQPYIKGFFHRSEHGTPADIVDLDGFIYFQRNPQHICQSFGKVIGVKVEHSQPWLALPESKEEERRFEYAVINVTPRYRDKVYNWKREIKFLRKNTHWPICFLGKYEEFQEFTDRYGKEGIRFRRTENLLDAAQIIQGAKYFSGTQSALLAIAQGLGHSYRFERSPFHDNCMTSRENETILNNHTRKLHLAASRAQEVIRNFLS